LVDDEIGAAQSACPEDSDLHAITSVVDGAT